ncbi:MAG: glycosyltransferase family 2 protein [Cyclobacteriaceae bacterium]
MKRIVEDNVYEPLVSVIMAAYNAEDFISSAIESVLLQTYQKWELLVIDDGSEDHTEDLINAFADKRIQYFRQSNRGASAARNAGLKNMKGELFCFLDADDALTPESLKSRIEFFDRNPDVSFVDGMVGIYNKDLIRKITTYRPSFRGFPLQELIKLNGTCFIGLTWMIKKKNDVEYAFCEGLTHAEDLLFLISVAQSGIYYYVETEVAKIRTGNNSAMSNLKGLEDGYYQLYRKITENYSFSFVKRSRLKAKLTKLILFSYLKKRMVKSAIIALSKFLWL